MREDSVKTEKSLPSLAWNGTLLELRDRRSFFLDLFHWVRLLTTQRKGKFISRRSDCCFQYRILSVFYDSVLANYVASLDFLLFSIKYAIFGSFVSNWQI